MRVESRTDNRLRISGDVYVEAATCADGRASNMRPENPLTIGDNWYPQFDDSKYSWYFRSTGATYREGRVQCDVKQHVWEPEAGDFGDKSSEGSINFECSAEPVTRSWLPQPTLRLTGTATMAGTGFDLQAFKTAPYYRGCLLEVDVMEDREWVGSVDRDRGKPLSFTSVYSNSGIQFDIIVDETGISEERDLTLTEIRQLLDSHQSTVPEESNKWRLWLLVGSELKRYSTLGIMFDDKEPYREGVSLFFDPELPDTPNISESARGTKLGETPLAFLRTAVHEIGHGFNLYHPKADEHGVPVGKTIMNQTSDIMRAASASNPFPSVATFAFHDHNKTSLIHSPDPQVKPRWKRFGYGHGEVGSGPATPSDLTYDRDTPKDRELKLNLSLPSTVCPGELAIADVSVENPTEESKQVTSALNITEDYLDLYVRDPDGTQTNPRNVVIFCTDRQTTNLAPGERLTGRVQLLFTNQGFTFDRPGPYKLWAELDLGDRSLKSEPTDVLVHSPLSEDSLDLSTFGLDEDVGRSIAVGDIGTETGGEDKLRSLAEDFTDTDLGTAAAIILSNAYSRDVRDIRGGRVTRDSDRDTMNYFLELSAQDRSAFETMRVATAVTPPGEKDAPILDNLMDCFDTQNRFDEEEIGEARDVLADFQTDSDHDTDDN
ncbi:hypothetical protein DJ74_12485 [Halorubrum sp. Ea8]|nr:hypothetical protein DJ74_12485 [Halorubrum sp. Ea8]